MTRRVGLAALAAAAIAGLAGCGSDEAAPSLLTGYGEGYSDGCDSGYADLGIPGFEYQGGGSLFGAGEYSTGWDKGYADCQNLMHAAAL